MAKYMLYIILLLVGSISIINNNSYASNSIVKFSIEEISSDFIFSDLLSNNLFEGIDDNDPSDHFVFHSNLKSKKQTTHKLEFNLSENIRHLFLLLNSYIDLPPPQFL